MLSKTSSFWIVVALALSWSLITPSWGRANERVTEFNIPPQSLDSALLVFAEQADVQVSVSTAVIAGMKTAGIAGTFTPSVALTKLLTETGLQFTTVGDRTYAVALAETPTTTGAAQPKQSKQPTAAATSSDTASPASAGADQGAKKKNPNNDSDDERNATELGDITVTGTHIRGVSPDASPTIFYDRKDIERSGATTVAEFARKIPQNFALLDGETFYNAGGDNAVSGNNTRASAINLRGLGPESTLVLMNGRRLAPSGSDGSFVDISTIPLSAVDRIEVLTDGGAALYGSDAIAGVVNFVLRRSFDGAETGLQWGDSSDGGAADLTASQLIGRSWSSGNGLLVYEYSDQEKLRADQRDYIPDESGVFDIFPDQRRHSAIASIRQELSPSTEIYADALFSDRQFDQTNTTFGVALQDEHGGATAGSAALGIGHDFSGGWRADLTGSYSRMREDREATETIGPDVTTGVAETDSNFSSLDILADGPIFELSGGKVRASLGATARREEIRSVAFGTTTESERDVVAAFGEILVPLVGASNAQPWATRLELSAAVRYDHYDDAGSSTDPRVGLLWSPIAGLNLRGTYATSYRVPPLLQLIPGQEYIIFAVPDATAPDGSSVTLFPTLPGNPGLGPEESSSFTFGLDFRPPRIPSLAFSATYFDIDFTDRILRPTDAIPGVSLFQIFEHEAILGPTVVDRSPDPAEIQRIFDNGNIQDFVGGTTPADIEVFLDVRLQNIAATKTSGLDVSAEYGIESSAGQFQLFLAGQYVLDLDFKTTPTAPTVSRLDQVFSPLDLRLQGGVSWIGDHTSSSLTLNYSDSYENPRVTPTERVESWVTADWQLSYQWGENPYSSLLSGVTVALNVQNLTNAEPPRITSTPPVFFDLQFDATNASPRGRFVSLNLRKKW